MLTFYPRHAALYGVVAYPFSFFTSFRHALLELLIDKRCLAAMLCFALNIIRKEKHFQHSKHDKQFDENNQPQRFSQCHLAKTVVVEIECLFKKMSPVHVRTIGFGR